MAKRKLKAASSFCSCRAHSIATRAAPWLKPRMPSKGPRSFTAVFTVSTLSSRPRLLSHSCWALKLRAWTSENHQPLWSSSPPLAVFSGSWLADYIEKVIRLNQSKRLKNVTLEHKTSRTGIFVAIANNTMYGSKLLNFLLCKNSLCYYVKIMVYEYILLISYHKYIKSNFFISNMHF